MKISITLSFILGFITAMLSLVMIAIFGSEYGFYRKTVYNKVFTKIVSCHPFSGDGFSFDISISESGGESKHVIRFISRSGDREIEASENADRVALQLSINDHKADTATLFIENKAKETIEFHKKKPTDDMVEHRMFNVQDGLLRNDR